MSFWKQTENFWKAAADYPSWESSAARLKAGARLPDSRQFCRVNGPARLARLGAEWIGDCNCQEGRNTKKAAAPSETQQPAPTNPWSVNRSDLSTVYDNLKCLAEKWYLETISLTFVDVCDALKTEKQHKETSRFPLISESIYEVKASIDYLYFLFILSKVILFLINCMLCCLLLKLTQHTRKK